MPRYDFSSQRLFVEQSLVADVQFDLDRAQSNYLLNVLRLKEEASILVFNGHDGEWSADLIKKGRKDAALKLTKRVRPQTAVSDLHYLFAPIKQARMEYMVQKAVEMGAGVLQPVFTYFTQLRKLNADKMRAHAIEAAEQCGILSLPRIHEPMTLKTLVDTFPTDRHLIFCNEEDADQNPLSKLDTLAPKPVSVLIGPEGGFSKEEQSLLLDQPFVTSIPLGPRVLRADTAAVAALAVVQARLGDWKD